MSTSASSGDGSIRAGNADRERVVAQLNAAFSEGRLDVAELDERVAAAYAAKTLGELVPLTADLPAGQQTVAFPPADGDEGGTARVNLRLPAHLKARAEEAASQEGLSVNAWLVRAVSAAVDGGTRPRATGRTRTVGQSFTGWVR